MPITSPPYATQREYDPASGFRPVAPDDYVDWFREVAASIASVLADDGSYFLNIKAHADEGERNLYVMDLVLAHRRQWGWRFDARQLPQSAPAPGAFVRWEDNHYESEADSAEALLLMAVRTGQRGFFDQGEAWARYFEIESTTRGRNSTIDRKRAYFWSVLGDPTLRLTRPPDSKEVAGAVE